MPQDKPSDMKQRFNAIMDWCAARECRQVYRFFRDCNPKLEQHRRRIEYVMHRNTQSIKESDDAWLSMMESAIVAVNSIEQL